MMLTIDSIITAVEQYHPQADTALIRRAYLFAAEAHKHQKRKSGIPYITHPLEVASILTELQMDAMTIASALLHDTIEDTSAGEEQIASEFSPEVAALVSGVTKLGKLEFFSQEERQAESFRKMLVAMAKDIRVILVKLADRLHNLRTLNHVADHKQRLVARETLEIYAPLAHRLGITWMKAEMEDLSFFYLHPRAYQEIEAQFTGEQDARERYLAQMQETVAKELAQMNIDCRLSGRPKHYYSIHQKMQSQQLPFEEVHDLLAVRVITDTVRNCYAILGIIHALWKPIPGRFKDYIALPKPNMYQSLHTTVLGPERQRVELQIRTEEMHRTAEEGIAAHWHYKERGATEENEEYFAWLRRLMEWQQDLKDPIEFMETVRIDMFPEEVYVFTPARRGEDVPAQRHGGGLRLFRAYGRGASVHRRQGERPHGAAALSIAQRGYGRSPHLHLPRAEPRLAALGRHATRSDTHQGLAQVGRQRTKYRLGHAQPGTRNPQIRVESAALREDGRAARGCPGVRLPSSQRSAGSRRIRACVGLASRASFTAVELGQGDKEAG